MDKETKPHHPHDHLARKVFGKPEEAAGFFREYLPEDIAIRIDAGKLHREPVSFVDEALKGSAADLLYRLEDEGEELWLYCLFEHQSQPDKWMPLRLLRYMVRIWERHLEHHPPADKLPPIIPIVLHHGKQGWSAARTFQELIAIPKGMENASKPMLPEFSFPIVDLASMPYQEIRGTLLGRLTMQALKAVTEDQLVDFMERNRELMKELFQAGNLLDVGFALLRYFHDADTSVDKQGFMNMVKAIESKTAEDAAMTIAQQYIDQGRQEGRVEGREQERRELVLRMNATGMDVEQIMSITGFKKQEVLHYLAQEE